MYLTVTYEKALGCMEVEFLRGIWFEIRESGAAKNFEKVIVGKSVKENLIW